MSTPVIFGASSGKEAPSLDNWDSLDSYEIENEQRVQRPQLNNHCLLLQCGQIKVEGYGLTHSQHDSTARSPDLNHGSKREDFRAREAKENLLTEPQRQSDRNRERRGFLESSLGVAALAVILHCCSVAPDNIFLILAGVLLCSLEKLIMGV